MIQDSVIPIQEQYFPVNIDECTALINSIPEEVKNIKWKTACHQVVIQTPNFFYKIYEDTPCNSFMGVIRKKLGEIYQSKGIDWQIQRYEKDGLSYEFERREYLDVIDDNEKTFQEIIVGVTNILDELEQSLELDKILMQLKERDHRFTRVKKIKLWRDAINKNIDYALTKDGQIVLLDDADWFLAFIDPHGNLIEDLSSNLYHVTTSYGDFVLSPYKYNFADLTASNIEILDAPQWQWFLRPADSVDEAQIYQIADEKKKMLQNTIKYIDTVSNKLLLEERKMTLVEELQLYTNNTGRKSFQWELWHVCNSLCKFCIAKNTPILMADLTFKEAQFVESGDKVIGFKKNIITGDFTPVESTVYGISKRHFTGKLYGEYFSDNHPMLSGDFENYVDISKSTSQVKVNIGKDLNGNYVSRFTVLDGPVLEDEDKIYDDYLYNFETSTQNYVANNLIVHNCYLGTDNRSADKQNQLSSIARCMEAIDKLDFSQYNNISLIGGEFFQGQMDDLEIKEAFFNLIRKIGQLYLDKKIGSTWITATLTIGDQHDLYQMLQIFEDMGVFPQPEYGASGLWLCTSWDQVGRFHNPGMKENWEYHMINIKKKFPWVKFNTTLILTEPFCKAYLNDDFVLKDFKTKFNTTVLFKQGYVGYKEMYRDKTDVMDHFDKYWLETKQKLNEQIGFNFFTTRKIFCDFLCKFASVDRGDYERLFDISFRSDELHLNFNDKDEDEMINRFKGDLIETSSTGECVPNKCGHIYNYAPYIDSNDCCICDRDTIFEATASDQIQNIV